MRETSVIECQFVPGEVAPLGVRGRGGQMGSREGRIEENKGGEDQGEGVAQGVEERGG